ncbi:MAG: YcaO-like family protein, partial [Aldersonia sp.]|nr:YcaO-like family protein [Aldersonia sp.]
TNEVQSFQDAFEKSDLSVAQPDLAVDLDRVVARYLGTGLDVIVVDQTTPEQAAGDLRCVKVIVPGTLPITFGYRHQRTTGFERLTRVPWELGYAPRPLAAADLNPDPHPFP